MSRPRGKRFLWMLHSFFAVNLSPARFTSREIIALPYDQLCCSRLLILRGHPYHSPPA
jgi:hypothetical protein